VGGDTLVVESTKFKSGTNLRGFGSPLGMGVFTRPDFHLIERFSVAAPDMLLYMFETACHEGNYGPEFILRGARAEEISSSSTDPMDVTRPWGHREIARAAVVRLCSAGGDSPKSTRRPKQ
jgi:hypothetical protein